MKYKNGWCSKIAAVTHIYFMMVCSDVLFQVSGACNEKSMLLQRPVMWIATNECRMKLRFVAPEMRGNNQCSQDILYNKFLILTSTAKRKESASHPTLLLLVKRRCPSCTLSMKNLLLRNDVLIEDALKYGEKHRQTYFTYW